MVRSGDKAAKGSDLRTDVRRRGAASRPRRHQAAPRALYGRGHVALPRVLPAGSGPRLHARKRRSARRRARVGTSAGTWHRLCRPHVRLAAPDRYQHEAQRALRRRPARVPGPPVVLVGHRRAAGRGAVEFPERHAQRCDARQVQAVLHAVGHGSHLEDGGAFLCAQRIQLPRRRGQRLRRVARGGERPAGVGRPGASGCRRLRSRSSTRLAACGSPT